VVVLAKQLLRLVLLTEADPSTVRVVADQAAATRLHLLSQLLVLAVEPTSIHLAVAVLLARLVPHLRLVLPVLPAHPSAVALVVGAVDLRSRLLLLELLAVLVALVEAVAVAGVSV
jgi:hypothetical protein